MTAKEAADKSNITAVIALLLDRQGGDWTEEIKTLNEISGNIGVKCWITKKEKGDKHDT